ncbi:TetR/AcrR family transcriptional regulator [Saccharothrix sp. NPDC042600]|uniref:TetR/AcrR family transcriptional regulator n=1 Tax=Saccharothrix TaxID=2071 RepID=UPI0033F91633|nr:TetR/AcrR family transcriptional regulator [Saccharothrix mutabilis subsp. capreolus]
MPVAKGSTVDPARTRAAILDAATRVFYERGLDGVGVAELCGLIGVSKETLYRHFGTKDDLVDAVLELRSERVTRWLADAAEAAGDSAAARLAAVFDALRAWYSEPTFRGCALVNAAAQHHAPRVRAITSRHLNKHLALLTDIARRAECADPDAVGRQLLMLLEGATIVADQHGPEAVGTHARTAALALLATAHP